MYARNFCLNRNSKMIKKSLFKTNFQWETMTVKRSERFRPYIVVFYAWWAEHVESYLKLIKASVEEMQRLSVRARFAWVNVGQEKKGQNVVLYFKFWNFALSQTRFPFNCF